METLARRRSDLCVVILQNSETLTNATAEWKTKETIQQWKIEISQDASQVEDFEFEFTSNKNLNIINAKFRREYYRKLKLKFAKIVTQDKNFDSKNNFEARKFIRKR